MVFSLAVCAIASYLLGCISFGLLVSKGSGLDIRTLGSKSTGATNVSRVLGIGHGLATFIGDFFKGLLAVLVSHTLLGRHGALVAGLFVVIGHNWPVFYQFKGGKGIATSCAVLLFLFPAEAALAIAACLIAIVLTRYVSVGSLVLVGVTALASLTRHPLWPDGLFCLALFALAVWRHRKNIERLASGTENKFSLKKKD